MSIADLFGPDGSLPGYPAFANELAGTLAVHSQYVLYGNIRDLFLVEQPGRAAAPMSLTALLWEAMSRRGYECLICYDPVHGIRVYPEQDPAALAAARSLLGRGVVGRRPSMDRLDRHLAKTVGVPGQPPFDVGPSRRQQQRQRDETASDAIDGDAPADAEETAPPSAAPASPGIRAAFVIDLASRLIRMPGSLDVEERDFFRYCLKLALAARPLGHQLAAGELYNPVIWLADGERDLPAWLTAGVEPVRTIALGMPTLRERTRLAEILVRKLRESGVAGPVSADRAVEEFAQRTDGMTLRSMTEIARLLVDRRLPVDRIADAVRIYKLGIDDNPWQGVREQIVRGELTIRQKVKGQPQAILKTLDILKRAALGLSGAQATSTDSRPRGVLFFAGPTGVGKTELAKRIAALLFGDVNSYLRFDMSEFAAEHAAHRLIGAPPGYVGFEAGGELTGAVRSDPFRVILFDEIEKAHRGVLDKFLQILEDGRLTDGQGVTTYFSECVIIFTSNLGVTRPGAPGEDRKRLVRPGDPYDVVENEIKTEIHRHFTEELVRPELLNRLGDNIVVFNYIDAETAAEICRDQMENIFAAVRRRRGITVEFADEALKQALIARCTEDLEHGGRGIGNRLESYLINPLARYVFDKDVPAGARVELTTAVLPELAASSVRR